VDIEVFVAACYHAHVPDNASQDRGVLRPEMAAYRHVGRLASHNVLRMMSRETIGLIPAAGQANRIAPLPCSKELYPVGFRIEGNGNVKRPKVVSHHLLEKMRLAGVSRIYFVLRTGKWDIPGYYGDGSMLNVHVAYLVLGSTWGVPFTLDHAYPFVRHSTIAFGFPDILFQSKDAFEKLMDRQSQGEADAVLGLFGRKRDPKYDAVDFDDQGTVRNLTWALPASPFATAGP
jgi:glucose-1-phosphate thymidylyltransferase